MSDQREQFVDLSTPTVDAAARGAQVRAWLRTSGWAVEATDLEDWLFRGAQIDVAGPAAFDALPALTAMTIAVTEEPQFFIAGGQVAPRCPTCGTAVEEDPEFYDLLGHWTASEREPDLSCGRCGHRGRIGNWDVRDSGAHGSVGVVVDPHGELVPIARHRAGTPGRTNPDEAASVLLGALRENLGGRWAWVHLHV